MSSLRLRLVLLPPFEERKYLLPLPADTKTITSIKRWLVKSLNSISCLAKSSKDIILEVEGFELLGACDVDIIREGDVVAVKLAPGPSRLRATDTPVDIKPDISQEIGRKRKRESATPTAAKSHATMRGHQQDRGTVSAALGEAKSSLSNGGTFKVEKPTPGQSVLARQRSVSASSSASSSSLASSSSSSSASASSSSSSSSSSSTSPSSEADSESSSSSSPASEPAANGTARRMPAVAKGRNGIANGSTKESLVKATTAGSVAESYPTAITPLSSTVHVPPGQGKASTKDRNARRKIARAMRKAAATTGDVIIPARKSTSNGIAASLDTNATKTSTTSALPVPKAMANRNKKKGFLKEMMAVQGTKTVFVEDEAEATSLAAADQPDPAKLETTTVSACITEPDTSARTNGTPQKEGNQWYSPSVDEAEIPVNLFVSSVQHRHTPYHARHDRHSHAGDAATLKEGPATAICPVPATPTETAVPAIPTDIPTPPVADAPLSNMARLAALAKTKSAVSNLQAQEQAESWSDGAYVKADASFADASLANEALFEAAKQDYYKLPPLDVVTAREGDMVCWPEVALNMVTFSPELVYNLARIQSVADPDSARAITLRLIPRPVPIQEDWGMDGETGYEGEDGLTEEEPQAVVESEVVLSADQLSAEPGKYRVVQGAA